MANPIPGWGAVDLNDGNAATYFDDGSVMIWNISTGQQVGGWGPQQNPVQPSGGPFDVAPGNYNTAPAAPTLGAPTAPRLGAPTGPVGTRRPGEDFNYGPTRPGAGRYPGAAAFPGQVVPGRPTDIPFGSTVAPSTWNPAMPSQGRGEGWGSIGAGTAGIPFGWGVPGFGQNPIPIRPEYLTEQGGLFDPRQAPGYIPGSGTFNQFRLDQPGLFGTIPGQTGTVNLRYGLGGTGDPTTGREAQTPMRWVTGNPAHSTTSQPNDDEWRRYMAGQGR